MTNELLRKIPKVDDILKHKDWKRLVGEYSEDTAKDALRECLDELRLDIKEGRTASVPLISDIIGAAQKRVALITAPRLKRVINGTGIIIHTNLGRSLLAQKAIDAIVGAASHYTNLEYDLKKGTRGDRYEHCTYILKRLTGAESALVVNNNAGAAFLILNTLAEGKEAIISRGELVEIGGSFRIPDVMKKSGAILREVGTTNRTYIEDYERAITENTGLLMKVHTSNFRIRGFAHEVDVGEITTLGRKHNIPTYYDAGSGLFYPIGDGDGLDEPLVKRELVKGLDVISFSGDKLLGAPQAGIILGEKQCIDMMRKNPMTRALRPDRFTLAGLESTLLLYLDMEDARREIPTLSMIFQDEGLLKRKAQRIAAAVRKRCGNLSVSVAAVHSEVGGGSLPDVVIPSFAVALKPEAISVERLEERLRSLDVPIIGRIERERLIIDMRTILRNDEPFLVSGIEIALKG
ncbi:MAG: L-seryl-tRNA(Sec) selenium transferase [Syntrophorhabdus sp. PtaU1.Bin058]|nr:MAG: L-seryl-tRNA(Sec) selenium transferase [Syntrophorhabdus sp. PtaU1.Bin058]